MTATPPVATVNGCRLFDDGLGGLAAYRGNKLIGTAFPQNFDEPDGKWFARRRGMDARLYAGRRGAMRGLTKETKP